MGKVIFIGWDSAEPTLLDTWIKDGSLPNLARLKQQSQISEIAPLEGMDHAVLWNSLSTGLSPADHGQYSYRQLIPGTYSLMRFSMEQDLKGTPFWVLLGESGKKVAVVDVPKSPLTPGVNGIQITDWTAHGQTDAPRSSPPDYIQGVEKAFGADPFRGRGDRERKKPEEFNALKTDLTKRCQAKTELTCQLIKSPENYDFVMSVFADSHDAGHFSWHLHDRTHPQFSQELFDACGNLLKQVYQILDQGLGQILDCVQPDEDQVLFFAGPGTGPNFTANHLLPEILFRLQQPALLNKFGLSQGLFNLENYTDNNPFFIKVRRKIQTTVPWQRTAKSKLNQLKKQGRRISHLPASASNKLFFSLPYNTKAGAIRLNIAGREANGRIKTESQEEKILQFLEEELLTLEDLFTHQKIVKKIIRVADTYSGTQLSSFPDLIVLWERVRPVSVVRSPRIGTVEGKFDDGIRPGDHTENNWFLTPRNGPTPLPRTVYDISTYVLNF